MNRVRRRVAVRLCLALLWLFRHTPLKRLAVRTEKTTRFQSTEAYIADRISQVPEYEALFSPFTSFRGKVVAELGCSVGYLLDAFRRREDFSAIGIDIDPTALAFGRETYGDRITFVQSAATAIPLPSESVDVLYSIDTVEHLNPPREIFLECARILRPGGAFLVHFDPWWGPVGAHLEDIIVFPWPHVLFSMDTLLTAAAEVYESPEYIPACYWFDPQTGDRRANPYRDQTRWGDYLNHLTVRGFRDLLKTLPFEVVHFEKRGFGGNRFPLARHLSALAQLPRLDEFFTRTIFCVLKKPVGATAERLSPPSPQADPPGKMLAESWWGIGAGSRSTGVRPEANGDSRRPAVRRG